MRKRKGRLRIALPDGHLQEETGKLFHQAMFELRGYAKDLRIYRPTIRNESEIDVKVLRPQEIPPFVAQGAHDLGITGHDWLEETAASVERLLNLEYGGVRLVLAMPKPIKERRKINDTDKFLEYFWGKPIRIVTEYMHLAQDFICGSRFYKEKMRDEGIGKPALIFPWTPKAEKSPVEIILSWGATEAKPPDDADAIIDNIGTGRTLESNDLAVVDTVLEESTAWLIANRDSCVDKNIGANIRRLETALAAAVIARKRLHIFANLPKYSKQRLRASRLWRLAQQEPTVVESGSAARIDLLIAPCDYHHALDSLCKLGAKDIITLQPQGVGNPSKAIDN